MLGALLYFQFLSVKNLAWLRLRRLRQPKYLVGAIFGAAYFSMIFLRPFLMAGRRPNAAPFPSLPHDELELLAAGALLLVVAVGWLLPISRAGLIFSEAEIAFLFPAPVSRRTLVSYKLLKAQMGILVTVGFISLVSLRFASPSATGRGLIAAWLVLSLLNLHSLGVSFTLQALGHWTRKRRLLVMTLAGMALAGLAGWAVWTVPALRLLDFGSILVPSHLAQQVAGSPPLAAVLWPFRVAVRPFLTANAASFLLALGPALALLAAHYLWVLRMDVAFEESSIEASRRHAARVAALRGGNRLGAATRPPRKARAPFRLAATGAPSTAILWKNLVGAGSLFSLRVWLPVFATALAASYASSRHWSESLWAPAAGTGAAVLSTLSALVGPGVVRQDFRRDIAVADLLKTYPLSGRQMAWGQLAAPVAILSAIQWLLLGVAAVLLDGAIPRPWELAACLALLVPTINLVMLLIPNAAALLYPDWTRTAQTGRRGLEVTGQGLLIGVASLAIYLVTLAPAAGVFALVNFVFAPLLLPAAAALPAATVCAALILGTEGFAGLMLLGSLFDRFDPSAETA